MKQATGRGTQRVKAVVQALVVTFLWSTSWVLIKIGLQDIPALTFAGLRYSLAFTCLLPFFLRSPRRVVLRRSSKRMWAKLVGLGILFYAMTQGAVFLGLAYLPAVTVNLMLSLTSVWVALLGIGLLAEVPSWLQWIGVGLSVIGATIYFCPIQLSAGAIVGLIAVSIAVLSNAGSSILGRAVNRRGDLDPLTVTVVSMGVGGLLLLFTGVASQGLPPINLPGWGIIVWLAVVNTAVAFTLWNHTLRTLTAMESSIINTTMMIQIPILAFLFLNERLTGREILGLLVTGLGVLLVQLRRARRQSVSRP